MHTIDVQDIQDDLEVNTRIIRRQAKKILSLLGKESSELSVVVCDNKYIRMLNLQYLGKDKPTNVISFPQQEGEGIESVHLGDIVISAQRAAEEAVKAGIEYEERMLQLLIHGICHLCGFDHENVSVAASDLMRKKERELLGKMLE